MNIDEVEDVEYLRACVKEEREVYQRMLSRILELEKQNKRFIKTINEIEDMIFAMRIAE